MVTTTPIYHPLSHSGLKVPKLWLGAMMGSVATCSDRAQTRITKW